MSWAAIRWARAQTVGNGIAKAVLCHLAEAANEQGECWRSIPTISKGVEHGEAAVKRAVKLLCELGLLEREGRATDSGKTLSPLWRIRVGCGAQAVADTINGHEVGESISHPPGESISSPPGESISTPESPLRIPLKNPSSLRDAPPAAPTAREGQPAVNFTLMSEGLRTVRDLTGRSEGACRALIGRWRRDAGDDCARVLEAIRRAGHMFPAEPEAFIAGLLGRRDSFDEIEARLMARFSTSTATAGSA